MLPENIEEMEKNYKATIQEGKFELAIPILEQKSRVAPEMASACYQEIGEIYRDRLSNIPQAIANFETSIVYDPYNLASLESVRLLFLYQKNLQKYLLYSEKKLQAVVDNQQAIALQIEMANICEQEKQWEEMEKYLKRILKIDPTNDVSLHKLRTLYSNQKRYRELVEILEKLAMYSLESTKSAEYYEQIADIYEGTMKQLDLAFSFLEKAHQAISCNITILRKMYKISHTLGDTSQIIYCLNHLIKQVRDNKEISQFLCELAQYHVQLNQENLAISYYNQAFENFPCLATLDALIMLYRKNILRQELLVALDKKLQFIQSSEEENATLQEAGSVAVILEKFDQAIYYYQKIWQSNQEQSVGIILTNLYSRQKRWPELAQLYESQLPNLSSTNEKVFLFRKLAKIYEDLQNTTRFKSILQEMMMFDFDQEVVEKLKKICRETQDWFGLLAVIKREISKGVEDKKIELYLEMAEIYSKYIPDLEQTIQCYQHCLELQPTNPRFCATLSELFLKKLDYTNTLLMYEHELALQPTPDRTIAIALKKASIYQDKYRDIAKAEETLLTVLRLFPESLPILNALESMYVQGRWQELVEIFDRKSKLVSPQEASYIQQRMAYIYDVHLQNPAQKQFCLEQALLKNYAEEIAQQLLLLYQQNRDWPSLKELYQISISHAKDDMARIAWLFKLACLYQDELEEIGQAEAILLQILKVRTNYLPAIKALQYIYQRESNVLALAECYLAELALPETPNSRRVCLHIHCARIFSNQKKELAIQHYQQAFKCDTNNVCAVRGLEELYRSNQMYIELANTLLIELGVEKRESRLFSIHQELSQLYLGVLDNITEGIKHLLRAYRYQPNDISIQKQIEETLPKHNCWDKYVEYLEEKLGRISEKEHFSYHCILGYIYEQKLGQTDKALQHLESALNLGKLGISDLQFMQGIYLKSLSSATLPKLILAYTQETLHNIPVSRLLELYQEIAILSMRAEDWEKATIFFEKVLAIVPKNKIASDHLAQIYLKFERWQELVQLLIRNSYQVEDNKKKESLFIKIANIFERKLKNTDQAMSYYQKANFISNSIASLQGIHRILEQKKDWYGIIAVLYKELDTVPYQERASIYHKIAKLWESKLQSSHQAILAYWNMLNIKFNMDVAESLIPLLKGNNDSERLAELLEKMLDNLQENSKKRSTYWYELGQVYMERLSQLDKAIVAYQNSLKISLEVKTILALEEIYYKQKNWLELVKIKESKLNLLTSSIQLRNVHLELGELYQNKLYDERKAILHYERGLEIDNQHLGILHNLQKLYKEWGYFDDYIRLCEKEIALVQDSRRKLQLLKEIAITFERNLFHINRAIQVWNQVWQTETSDLQSIQSLIRLYQEIQDFVNLAKMYRFYAGLLEKNNNITELIPLLIQLAKLYDERLQDSSEAEHIAEKILGMVPENRETLDFLDSIYTKHEDFLNIQRILQSKLCMDISQEERLSLYMRLAQVCEELKDWQKMEDSLKQAYSLSPSPKILRELQKVYRQINSFVQLIEVNLSLIQQAEAKEKIALYWEICEKLEKDDLRTTVAYLEKILELDPNHIPTLAKLADLLIALGETTKALQIFDRWLNSEESSVTKSSILYRRGKLYCKSSQEDLALATFEEAFQVNPEHLETVAQLADIYYRLANWERSQGMYERLLYWPESERLQNVLPKQEIYFRLGYISQRLHKQEQAILYYRQALQIQENHLATLQQLGSIYYQTKQWEESLLIYMKLSQHYSWDHPETAQIQLKLSVIKDNLGMVEGAIEGYLHVLEKDSNDRIALEALGHLYNERKNMDLALQYFKQALQNSISADDQQRILRKIAEINETMYDLPSAITTYRELWDYSPHDLDILRKLTDLYVQKKEWENAEPFCLLSYHVCSTKQEQAELLLQLGNINWLGYRNKNVSEQYFRKALEISVGYIPAIHALIDLFYAEENWEELIAIYREFLPQIPDLLGEKIPLLLQLAQVTHEKLHDETTAISVYEQILKISPEHSGAHAILATLYSKHPNLYSQAVIEYRYLLAQDPLRAIAYHELYKIYLSENQYDHAYLCCQSLEALNNLLPEEHNFLKQIPNRVPSAWLDASLQANLIAPSMRGTLYEIMALLDPCMEKVYPPDLDKKYNLTRKNRLEEDSHSPIQETIQEICRTLAIQSLDVYVVDSEKIFLENTQPPSLIIGSKAIARLTPKQVRFVLAHYLFYISQNQVMACKLTPFEYKNYVQRVVEAFAETGQTTSLDVESMSKKIRSILPRKIRKQLEDRLDILTELYQSETEIFQQSLEQASNHCGLLLAESLVESCQAYFWLNNLEVGKSEKLPNAPYIHDIFWFYNSDTHIQLRKEIGIAIKWLNKL